MTHCSCRCNPDGGDFDWLRLNKGFGARRVAEVAPSLHVLRPSNLSPRPPAIDKHNESCPCRPHPEDVSAGRFPSPLTPSGNTAAKQHCRVGERETSSAALVIAEGLFTWWRRCGMRSNFTVFVGRTGPDPAAASDPA